MEKCGILLFKKKKFHEKFPSCTSLNIIENLQPIFECVLQAVFFFKCYSVYLSRSIHI